MIVEFDFTKEQQTQLVHGFPITFRRSVYNERERYWLPRGISRNDPAKCWRLWIRHAGGVFTEHVHDDGLHRSESLGLAWRKLVSVLESLTPIGLGDQRELLVGWERLAELDSGVTGVGVSRACRKGKRYANVYANHSIALPNGKTKQVKANTGYFSELRYEKDPDYWEGQFARALRDAVAIRRFYNGRVAQLNRPLSTLDIHDVPMEVRRLAYDVTLRLDAAFENMDVT